MIMSNLIDEDLEAETIKSNPFIEKLKALVNQQLKKNTIIFTITHQNTKFHYYTTLNPQKHQFIELYWVVQFLPNKFSLSATFSTYRTMGIPLFISDMRTRIQINSLLRILNKNLPYFLTFLLNQKDQACIVFQRSISHDSDRNTLLKGVVNIVSQIFQQCIQGFLCLVPYLSIPIENYIKTVQGQKDFYQSQEFNLIKIKNTFDRLRKNRQKTSDLIYEQKDINKVRKKIQNSATLLAIQLKSLSNMNYATKQIRRDKLLQIIQSKFHTVAPAKVDKIAYQFQILNIEQSQTKFDIKANSQIFMGKYNFRIFKTLIEQQKISKSQNYKKNMPVFQEKDVIEQRISKLVKKKPNSKISQKALKNQISFLKFMRNQVCLNIANYYLPLQNSGQLYIMHYEESLLNIIQSQKIKSFMQRLSIMIKLVNGLKFITDTNICHRDIKPSNIMMSQSNDPKIIDFGSSISVYNHKVIMTYNQKLCSTLGYHQPYNQCDQKIKYLFTRSQYEAHPLFDIFSFGVILQKIFSEELKQNYNHSTAKDTLTYTIEKCKEHNPDNRLSYDEVLCLLLVLKKTISHSQKTQTL